MYFQTALPTPTSAIAVKLKQQVPRLQAALLKRGWQGQSSLTDRGAHRRGEPAT